ncbi:MAG: response regulator transcription factor [Candidatus Marinarcus sp.]|uniref:response regulator transcription factor n=1 Tax=Candidatus Marinarcus sp. TaxID=3100987 RepID=UPI003B00134A
MKTQDIKILFVEDDEIARENGVEYLRQSFKNVYEAKNGLEAMKLYEAVHPDIIITDIQMPKINGLEFVESIRRKDKKTQIIVLSAFSTKAYLLKAVELQLVKYLIKPISQRELDSALALCCKGLENGVSNIIQLRENSCFDAYNKTLFVDDEMIKLRTKELLLLELLLKNKTRYVSYEEIEQHVWEESAMSKDALKTVVRDLKNKLPSDSILNLSKVGYKINV